MLNYLKAVAYMETLVSQCANAFDQGSIPHTCSHYSTSWAIIILIISGFNKNPYFNLSLYDNREIREKLIDSFYSQESILQLYQKMLCIYKYQSSSSYNSEFH